MTRWSALVAALGLLVAGTGLTDATLATEAAHAPRALVGIGQFVTAFGTSEYMFAYAGLIAFVAVVALGRGHREWHGGPLRLIAGRACYVFAAVAASGIIAQIVKHVVGRARPALLAADGPFSFRPLSIENLHASFPSGHTTSAFAAAVALGAIGPRWRWWLLACALLIGVSRVLVGAHYPSDVLGGAALGSATSLILARDFARRGLAFARRETRATAGPRGSRGDAGGQAPRTRRDG